MGRKKTYDRQETAERALQTFWEKGFERTSLKDLELATGVNRYGLYDSFEDKQGLFQECIEHYVAGARTMLDDLADQGLDGLLALIRRFAEPGLDDNACQNGCMVVTSLLEREGLSPQVQQVLKEHITYLLDHVRTVLEREQRAGNLRSDLVIEECVEFVHLFLVGLPTMSRISSDDSGMRLAAKAAMGSMQAWRT